MPQENLHAFDQQPLNLCWAVFQIITQVQSAKKELPEGMYNLYFDYLESGQMPDNVDLRANTTIFVH